MKTWIGDFNRRLFGSRLRTNIVASGIGTVISAGVSLIGYPIYLKYLGFETYGIWLSISVVNSVAQLGSIGFGPAVTKFVAEDLVLDSRSRVLSCVATAMTIVFLLGTLTTTASAAFAGPIASLFGFQGQVKQSAEQYLPWIAVLSTYTLLVQIRSAALVGTGRADLVATGNLAGRIAALAFSWLLLACDLKIAAMLLGQFVGQFVYHVAVGQWARREAGISFPLAPEISPFEARRLVRFGRSVLGNSLVQLLLQPANRVLLARYAGVDSVPVFEVAWAGSMQIRGVISTALQALLPDFSKAAASGDHRRVRGLLKKAYGLVLLSTPLFAIVVLMAPYLLRLWLGDSLRLDQTPAFRVMMVSALITLVAVPGYFHLLGVGRPGQVFVGHALLSLTNLGVALLLVLVDALTPVTLGMSAAVAATLSSAWLIERSSRAVRT